MVYNHVVIMSNSLRKKGAPLGINEACEVYDVISAERPEMGMLQSKGTCSNGASRLG